MGTTRNKKFELKKMTREVTFKKNQVYAPINHNGVPTLVIFSLDLLKEHREKITEMIRLRSKPLIKYLNHHVVLLFRDQSHGEDLALSLGEEIQEAIVQNKLPFSIYEELKTVMRCKIGKKPQAHFANAN